MRAWRDMVFLDWLRIITVDQAAVPALRKLCRSQLKAAAASDRKAKIIEVKQRLKKLREEARLGRLFITGKMTEETYEQLRSESQEKPRHAEAGLADLERDTTVHLDDLEVASLLITHLSSLYCWLKQRQRTTLLSIIAKRVIVNTQGEIVDLELQSPFMYLRTLAGLLGHSESEDCGSDRVRPGPPNHAARLGGYFFRVSGVPNDGLCDNGSLDRA